MIVKRRKIPLRIMINDAVLRRLPQTHPKCTEIKQDLLKSRAGHKGEQELDYFTSMLHEDDFHIFEGLRLNIGDTHFQMDSLLLSPAFALIIEAKNMAGTLSFDSGFNQMSRTYNDQTDTFEDPTLQAKRHRLLLKKWLKLYHLPDIPIEYLVFISNPGTALRNPLNNQEIYQRVCPPGKIIFKIEDFLSKYQKDILSGKEHKKLSKLLAKSDVPLGSHLDQLKIAPSEYITGVQCPTCSLYAMERYSGTWNCKHCNTTSKDAHKQALEDYFLLISPTITNNQFRKFIHLDSPKLATKLLVNLKLPSQGTTKNRVYISTQKIPRQALAEDSKTIIKSTLTANKRR